MIIPIPELNIYVVTDINRNQPVEYWIAVNQGNR